VPRCPYFGLLSRASSRFAMGKTASRSCGKMSCRFNSADECAVLDRLRVAPPKGTKANWRLHVVELRSKGSDRVYDFFGASGMSAGCFSIYPDNIFVTAENTAWWCNEAWPLLRHTPGPHRWLTIGAGLSRFISSYALFQANDVGATDDAETCWYFRFDESAFTLRKFAWFQNGRIDSAPWSLLQSLCHQLAAHSLRDTSVRNLK
jgi:hypothetical protein